MKENILAAIKLTLICIIVFCGAYTLLIWCIAQLTTNRGNGETVSVYNKVVGYKLIGQKFTQDEYFWSRPSAADYNATASAGSNKGPSNPDYLKQVRDRIDTFLVHNPGTRREQIPADMVTASGSGLDPDISPAGAYVQVQRVAAIRNLEVAKVTGLVAKNVENGVVGPAKVNVLQLNLALDQLK